MPEPRTEGTAAEDHLALARQPAPEAKGRDLGILAVVGLAVCCGLPVLVGAGTVAAIGGVLRNARIMVAAVMVAIGVVVFAVRRHARSADGCCRSADPNRHD